MCETETCTIQLNLTLKRTNIALYVILFTFCCIHLSIFGIIIMDSFIARFIYVTMKDFVIYHFVWYVWTLGWSNRHPLQAQQHCLNLGIIYNEYSYIHWHFSSRPILLVSSIFNFVFVYIFFLCLVQMTRFTVNLSYKLAKSFYHGH